MVRVFKNKTRNCFSIQTTDTGRWKTTYHACFLMLSNVTFVVSEKTRQRIIRTGKKTVHAYVCGDLDYFTNIGEKIPEDSYLEGVEITYNPKISDSFRILNTQPIERADLVQFRNNTVFRIS